jgi:hypothetical protein
VPWGRAAPELTWIKEWLRKAFQTSKLPMKRPMVRAPNKQVQYGYSSAGKGRDPELRVEGLGRVETQSPPF